MIPMKAKPPQKQQKPAARKATGKVHMSASATGLTSQAGLLSAIRFLQRIGFDKTVNQAVAHQRGDNAEYQLADGIFLTRVGMIAEASTIAKPCAVWSDGIPPKLTGWAKFPVDTTIVVAPIVQNYHRV
jgi:hypothetical protein